MATSFDAKALPPLPEYALSPLPDLLPPIPDKLLTLLLPIVVYWGLSMFFHWIDVNDYFAKYRLHTPAEVLKRNHVSRWEVVRDVVIQQIVQTAVGWLLGMTEPDDVFGKEEYDVAVWAQRIRRAQGLLPPVLAILSVNADGLAKDLRTSYPTLAGLVAGGVYPEVSIISHEKVSSVSSFRPWELLFANAIYWCIIPGLQFVVAIVIVDTWQYFLHRAMHMNKWLYSKICLPLCDPSDVLQLGYILVTTASTFRMLLAPCTTILWKAFSWIHWEQALRSSWQA